MGLTSIVGFSLLKYRDEWQVDDLTSALFWIELQAE